MPIILNDVTLQYKTLPITLHEDGSCTITLRKGYYDLNNNFMVVELENYTANPQEASAILDLEGAEGLSRRDDLSTATYQFCISKGAQIGVVT